MCRSRVLHSTSKCPQMPTAVYATLLDDYSEKFKITGQQQGRSLPGGLSFWRSGQGERGRKEKEEPRDTTVDQTYSSHQAVGCCQHCLRLLSTGIKQKPTSAASSGDWKPKA